MSNKPHPHAEVLRAIADGAPLSEFEYSKNNVYWSYIGNMRLSELSQSDTYIRRKPQYIMVNGFKVPKPLDAACERSIVWTPSIMQSEYADHWTIYGNISNALYRGIAHDTKEAAIAHAKAMLGIDPEAA